MQEKGTITSWNDGRGFGFITPKGGGKPIFVHINEFPKQYRRPELNLPVTYTLSNDKQGRKCAVKTKLDGKLVQRKKKINRISLSVIFAASFLVIVGVSVLAGKISPLILCLYVGSSLLTYFLYAKDKSAAQAGAWRTPEGTLHILSLACGWPGALFAQKKLRHKTKKFSFQMICWVTVLLNCSALVWLITPEGTATLNSIIDNILYRLTNQWS